jgi:sec-independent protein translocase protein TatA
MSIGFTEILLIFIAILLLFGAKRIPELVKAIARASHEYKKAKEMIKKEAEELTNETSEHTEPSEPIETTATNVEDKTDNK